jgi:hypothetical protein
MEEPKLIGIKVKKNCHPEIQIDCENIADCNDCPLHDNESDIMDWLFRQFKYFGDSDLSNVQVEDWVYTLWGWKQVTAIVDKHYYPVRIGENNFTYDGKYQVSHKHPSAWVCPPAYLNAPPKPMPNFKKGDKVLVKHNENDNWLRRYFCFYDADHPFPYRCFSGGKGEWTSEGDIAGWKYCKKWDEKE